LEEPLRSKSPSVGRTPAPTPADAGAKGPLVTPPLVAATAPRPTPLPPGVLNRDCQYGTSALTDDLDMEKVTQDLRDLHRCRFSSLLGCLAAAFCLLWIVRTANKSHAPFVEGGGGVFSYLPGLDARL